MSKRNRTLDGFFATPNKKLKPGHGEDDQQTLRNQVDIVDSPDVSTDTSNHSTYPFALPHLPPSIREVLNFVPASTGRIINDQPDLDLLYFQPYIPREIQTSLFEFLRRELFFYRVKYSIKRGPIETQINTPRYTTVFGVDETSRFDEKGAILDATTGKAVAKGTYKCQPRPLPHFLQVLKELTQNTTGCTFNFALVNYYSSGSDSISYHSDDERFLGTDPAIASFSLGVKRDFLLKHKPTPRGHESETKPMKFPLGPGDMILMKGKTQSNWLHSIPKRKGGDADRGRINITLRKAMVKGGTENYYRYNVGDGGDGEVYKWNEERREMTPWNS